MHAKNPDQCSEGSLNATPYVGMVTEAVCDATTDEQFCALLNTSSPQPFVGYVKYGDWKTPYTNDKTIRSITCN